MYITLAFLHVLLTRFNVIGPLYLNSATPLPEIIENQSVPLQKKRRSLKENKGTNLAASLYKNL